MICKTYIVPNSAAVHSSWNGSTGRMPATPKLQTRGWSTASRSTRLTTPTTSSGPAPQTHRSTTLAHHRETLDHSLPYIFAVALQDGSWHHETSYTAERAARPDTVARWHKISTVEDPVDQRYHASGGGQSCGGRVVVTLANGHQIFDEIRVADAHPGGARPFAATSTCTSSAASPCRCLASKRQSGFSPWRCAYPSSAQKRCGC